MKKKKVLILGGSGFLGSYLILELKKKYNLFSLENKKSVKNIPKRKIFKGINNLEKNILKIVPDAIIFSIGITDLEYCEKFKNTSYVSNFLILKKTVDLIKQKKIKLIYFSTDSFYNAIKKSKENSTLKAINHYSKCKLKSEQYILKNLKNFLIIRTNFYGNSKSKSLFNFVYENLIKNKKIKMFYNIYFTPIYIRYLCQITRRMMEKNITGIFNIGSSNTISKYDFGIKIAKTFNLNTNLIEKTKYQNNCIQRNYNTAMNIDKLKTIFKSKYLTNFETSIKNLKHDLNF